MQRPSSQRPSAMRHARACWSLRARTAHSRWGAATHWVRLHSNGGAHARRAAWVHHAHQCQAHTLLWAVRMLFFHSRACCCAQVWDLAEGSLAYQSAILCASPLTAIAMDPSFPRMALGAADGVVRFFDLASLPAVRSLQVRKLLCLHLHAARSSSCLPWHLQGLMAWLMYIIAYPFSSFSCGLHTGWRLVRAGL